MSPLRCLPAGGEMQRSFVVVCAHFYPSLSPEVRRQYDGFRSQFLSRGIPMITTAVGAHYDGWAAEFPEIRVVDGDLLFQKERLWNEGAWIAEGQGFERFLCLDADVIFHGRRWQSKIDSAFERFDVLHPMARIVHLYDDGRYDRVTVLRWLSGSGANRHLRPRRRSSPFLKAYGFGVGFNSR